MATLNRRPSVAGHLVLIAIFGLWAAAVTVILPVVVYISSTENNDRLGIRALLLAAVLYALLAGPAIVLTVASSRRLLQRRAAAPGFEVGLSQKTDL